MDSQSFKTATKPPPELTRVHALCSLTGIEGLPGSFSPATVKQEQRIRFDGLRQLASAQYALRPLGRSPDP